MTFVTPVVEHWWYEKYLNGDGDGASNDPLLLIGENNPCTGGSGFPFLLSQWSVNHMSGIV